MDRITGDLVPNRDERRVPHHVVNHPGRPMRDVLCEELDAAEEAVFVVAFIHAGGVRLLDDALQRFAGRGGRLRVLTSTYGHSTEPEALRDLLGRSGVALRIQDGPRGLHAKLWCFARSRDQRRLWVGSSNWTRAGLEENTEWNTLHVDPAVTAEAAAIIEALWQRGDVRAVDAALIDAYARQRVVPPGLITASRLPTLPSIDAAPSPHAVQREALERLASLRREGARRAVVIAAPGVGKTLLAAFDARAVGARTLLFLAHRKDIVEQASESFGRVFGEAVGREVWIEGREPGDAPFVFATVQSYAARARRDARGAPRRFEYVVVDEFHHAAADGWQQTLGELDAGFLLGLTATPERADARNVLELCDWNVAYEVRLPEAIRRDLLVPFRYFGIADELVDYAAIPWRRGRFDPDRLEGAVMLDGRVDALLAHAAEKGFVGAGRVAVGFCAGIRHARWMAERLRRRGVEALALTGDDDREARREVYRRLQDPADPLTWLFVADVLNEGVDLPAINTIAFLRPTESLGLFIQQLGRGLRKHPASDRLTVLDFVGQHRNAFLTLKALHDPDALPTAESLRLRRILGFELAPPPGCEIRLDDKTLEVLERVRAATSTRADRAREAYEQVRAEQGRPPRPIDFWDRAELPAFRELRDVFGGWRRCRIELGDADDWETAVRAGSPLDRLLACAERNWQAQRVTPYAVLWAALDLSRALGPGVDAFFEEHPQWRVERPTDLTTEAMWAELSRQLPPDCVDGHRWTDEVRASLRDPRVVTAVRERLLPTLATDFRLRHGGVLRPPEALRLFGEYSRQGIVNHFGVQYDPTRHNRGVITFGDANIALITKLDTRSAVSRHQYENRFVDERRFLWSSQNRQRRDNEAGREITEHRARGRRLHLFAQPSSHAPARYLGEVEVVSVEGDAPMRVTFRLPNEVPALVRASLEGRDEGGGAAG